jgi:hypothetical protein
MDKMKKAASLRPFLFEDCSFSVMKHLILLLAALNVSAPSFSQTDFCLPGAKWMYYNPGSASPPEQYHYLYVGDTLIDGFSDVKKLKKETRIGWSETWIQYYESISFFRQSNDSILQYLNGEFKLMFDFGAQVGDKRVVTLDANWGCLDQDTMVIDSIGTMIYQGESLTTYHFSLLVEDQVVTTGGYTIGGGNGMYVERLGLMADHPTDLFLGCVQGNTIAEYVPGLFVCYTDNELAVNFPDTCDLFLNVPSNEPSGAEISIHQNQLQVQNAPNSALRIYDILGKELFVSTLRSDNETIDLHHLPKGILMVVVESQESRFTKKVIKLSHL